MLIDIRMTRNMVKTSCAFLSCVIACPPVGRQVMTVGLTSRNFPANLNHRETEGGRYGRNLNNNNHRYLWSFCDFLSRTLHQRVQIQRGFLAGHYVQHCDRPDSRPASQGQ